MTWFQQIILWIALPLFISLILATFVALRAVVKAQDGDTTAKQHLC
jgi:hypothetical protein